MSPEKNELILPELGMGDTPIRASLWLVSADSEVTQGDRLLEIVTGGTTIDLPAPVSGRLTELLVDEDEPLFVGQTLAIIETKT